MKSHTKTLFQFAAIAAALTFTLTGKALANGTTPPTTLYTANGDVEEWTTSNSGTGASALTTGTEVNQVDAASGYYDDDTVVGSDGTVYVAAQSDDGSTTVISSYDGSLNEINSNVATLAITGPLQNPNNTESTNDMVISGNTLYALSSGYYNAQIDTVNLTTGAVAQLGDYSGESLNSIAIANGTIYGSAWGSGNIETIDATTGAVINSDFISLPEGYNSSPNLLIIVGNNIFVVDTSSPTDPAYNGTGQAIYEYNLTTGAGEGNLYTDGSGNTYLEPYIYIADGGINALSEYDGVLYVSDADGVQEFSEAYPGYDDSTGSSSGGDGELASSYDGLYTAGQFDAVAPDDLVGAAPEPRSWAFGFMALGVMGLLLQRRKLILNI